ncbi:hypothetical protein COO60DRAFT_1481170 [Scenedesmus sp. NREL 46B-D3]|nr:hypothetical protein COO60DRAFT_1481170 [Scenedesmus sp. NREL 46B-D3]
MAGRCIWLPRLAVWMYNMIVTHQSAVCRARTPRNSAVQTTGASGSCTNIHWPNDVQQPAQQRLSLQAVVAICGCLGPPNSCNMQQRSNPAGKAKQSHPASVMQSCSGVFKHCWLYPP